MRVTIDRGPLLEAVARVQSAAGNGKSIPILGMLLLQADGERLTVRATDLSLEAAAEAAASVERPGSACAPADQLHELLRSLPDGADLQLAIEPGDSRLAIHAGRGRFKLPTLDPGLFPVLPEEAAAEVYGVAASGVLARLLDKTLFAVSSDAARYHLQGVHLHVLEGAEGALLLRAAATNGSKLAYAEAPCPAGLEALPPLIVPTKLATELRRWLGELACDVAICASAARLRVEIGTGCLRGQLLDMTFPDYRRVVPTDPPNRARVDAAGFKAAVRRAAIAAQATDNARFKIVRVEIAPGQFAFSSRSAERGEALEELEADYDGPETSILFNAAHLLELVERIGSPQLELAWSEALDPVLMLDPGDPALRLLTMPVRG